jgi:hypothetical protein
VSGRVLQLVPGIIGSWIAPFPFTAGLLMSY